MESIGKILPFELNKPAFMRSKGFTMVPNWFIESSDFLPYEKLVAIVIFKHQKNKKRAWPSHGRIALQIGCCVSTVKKSVVGLEAKGILTIVQSNNHKSNVYNISFDKKKIVHK